MAFDHLMKIIDMTEEDNEIKGKRLGRVKTKMDKEMLASKY